jgi:hypothetical protein
LLDTWNYWPIAWHLEQWLTSHNWPIAVLSWKREIGVKSRFCAILTILPDFNLILPIFEFYERFSTFSLYWLVKSYDFTSWIAILTTLAQVLHFTWNREIGPVFTFFMGWPDFMRVWPGLTDFTGFRVLNPILHVLCILTRKIADFTSQNSFLTTMLHRPWLGNVWERGLTRVLKKFEFFFC